MNYFVDDALFRIYSKRKFHILLILRYYKTIFSWANMLREGIIKYGMMWCLIGEQSLNLLLLCTCICFHSMKNILATFQYFSSFLFLTYWSSNSNNNFMYVKIDKINSHQYFDLFFFQNALPYRVVQLGRGVRTLSMCLVVEGGGVSYSP